MTLLSLGNRTDVRLGANRGAEIPHLGAPESARAGGTMRYMRHHLRHILLTTGTAAVVAGGAVAPVATAASAGQTVKVTAKSAYVDNKAPGRVFSGTIFKGNAFKIDRVARVKTGPAKGLWYHGTATIT